MFLVNVALTAIFLLPYLVVPTRVFAEPIPAGCPGSQFQGPPAPGVCEAIPEGCPGAVRAGPPAPNVECPYDAPAAGSPEADQTFSDPQGGSTANFDADCRDGLTQDKCGIVAYLITFINLLTAVVGIVSVIMITVWGIQYSVSRDNPQMVSSARLHILQTVIAVIIYLFVYAFLQWIVPGGIF